MEERKNSTKEQMTAISERILSMARNEIYLSMRFLDTAFGRLDYQMNLSVMFLGTDGIHFFYHPRFLMERFDYNRILVNRGYFHLLLHCLFRHIYNRKSRDLQLWQLSCDIAVEYLLDHLECRAVMQLIPDTRAEVYAQLEKRLKVITAEGVYYQLTEQKVFEHDTVYLETLFLVDDHQFWEKDQANNKPDQNKNQDSKEKSEQEKNWKKISEKIQTNLETFSKNSGSDSGSILKSLKSETEERIDYRSFLRKFAVLKETMKLDQDTFDYGLYQYGIEMYHKIPLIEPLEYKEASMITEFVIILDTSGSCSEALIKRFLQETYTILKDTESFVKDSKLHIIQCDNMIQEDIVVSTKEDLNKWMDNFTVKGRGGTDFRPAFAYIDQLLAKGSLSKLKGMLYFTDGYGIFPERKPSYDAVFIFAEEDKEVRIPPWAMKFVFRNSMLKK